MSRGLATLFIAITIGLFTPWISNAEEKIRTKKVGRPKIGLALAGGGALGFAHVGVLKVIEEERIPIDIVTGTSMGAIVGGAYAAGRSVAEMEKVLTETDWDDLFDESNPRRDVPYRYKPGKNREIFGNTKVGFNENGIAVPAGVIQGQFVVPLLQRLYEAVPNPVKFDDLPLRFRGVAADIETGMPYIPSEGDLSKLVRASMSVPAVFAPVDMDGKLLVDGGVANNLPIDEAFKLGADIVIAVELYADLKKRQDLESSPLAVSGQIISLLLAQNSAIQRSLLRPKDILIAPDLKGYTATDFAKGKELMAKGEAAARDLIPRLKELSVSVPEYEKYSKDRLRACPVNQTVDFVRIKTDAVGAEDRIKTYLGVKEGDYLDRTKIEESIRGIFNTGQFESVEYEYVEENGAHGLEVSAKKKPWLDQYIRLGFALEDDLNGEDRYRLGAEYRVSGLNEQGAYLDLKGEIGRSPYIFSELYQPIDRYSPYFVAPSLVIGRTVIDVRSEGEISAEYDRQQGQGSVRAGRELGKSGEVALGYTRGYGELDRRIGDQSLPDFSYDIGQSFVRLDIDDVDEPDFPTAGTLFSTVFSNDAEALGSSSDFNTLESSVGLPVTFGRNTLLIKSSFAQTFEDRPVERSFSLGGFLNISGYEQNSLVASNYVTGQAIFYHRFSEIKLPLFGFDFFAGGSLELSNLRSDIQSIPDPGFITSGSTFIGANTPLLPAYFGFGLNDDGEHSLYLAIGRIASGRSP